MMVDAKLAGERKKAVDDVLLKIEKEFGKGSIMRLGDRPTHEAEVIPSGSLALDIALGIGGIPRGRIIEIFGPESSGKTTLCSQVIAEAQKLGETAAFIDVEHAYNTDFAKKIGVNTDQLIFAQPDSAEQALEIVESLIESGAVSVIVVDSVAALVPRAEIEGDMGDAHVGIIARLMSQAMRKLTSKVSKTNTTLIFTNQIREKIGVMYGNPETQPGGRALKFYCSIRIDVRKVEAIKEGTDVIGFKTKFKVVKNKMAPPMRIVETAIYFAEGISKSAELLELGTKFEIIKKSGAFFTLGDQKVQGLAKAKELLDGNIPLRDQIESQVRAKALESTDVLVGTDGGALEEIGE